MKSVRLNEQRWLALLSGLAILVRLVYVLATRKTELSWGDEFVYDQLARNVLEHGCYCFVVGQPSLWRPPLYPLILAGLYALFGYNYMAVLVVQAVVGGLAVPLTVLVGEQMSGSRQAGWLAGLMLALHPVFIFTTGLLYSETLYMPLLLAFAYGCIRLIHVRGAAIALAFGVGVLLGLSVLMRPNLILFPAGLLLWSWAAFRSLHRAVWVTASITLGMALTILPWSIRNFAVTGELVTVSANAGLNLLQGNHPNADGGALDIKYLDPWPELSEKERDDVYWQQGMEWIRDNPDKFFRLVPLKLYKFFSPLETSNRGQVLKQAAPLILAAFALFYLIALTGMMIAAKHWRMWLLAYLLIAYPALLAAVFYGGTRYGLVTQPFLALFAAEAVVTLVPHLRVFKSRV